MEEIHWTRLKVGIVFAILSLVLAYVMSAVLYPLWLAGTTRKDLALIMGIVGFLIYAYFLGWLVLYVAKEFGR